MDTQANSRTPHRPSALRFAVLRHEGHGPLHYDLLLERPHQDRLTAFRIHSHPDTWLPATTHAATQLPDHRRLYLAYEGPISGHRGHVTRILEGTWTPTADEPLAGTLSAPTRTITIQLAPAPDNAPIDNYQFVIIN